MPLSFDIVQIDTIFFDLCFHLPIDIPSSDFERNVAARFGLWSLVVVERCGTSLLQHDSPLLPTNKLQHIRIAYNVNAQTTQPKASIDTCRCTLVEVLYFKGCMNMSN